MCMCIYIYIYMVLRKPSGDVREVWVPKKSYNVNLHYLPMSNPLLVGCALSIAALAPTSSNV